MPTAAQPRSASYAPRTGYSGSAGIRTPSDALVGPTADATLRSMYVDVLFLGVHGMDPVAILDPATRNSIEGAFATARDIIGPLP